MTQPLRSARRRLARSLTLLSAVGCLCSAVVAADDAGKKKPEQPAARQSHKTHFAFRDVATEAGLRPAVEAIRGHAAGWGDVDGDGFVDLYVGAFHTEGSKPNMFFRNVGGKFRLDEQEHLRLSGRPTGSVFADLDNDGDLDLYVSSMPKAKSTNKAGVEQPALRGNALFRNDGKGNFTDVSEGNGACPPAFGGRSATVLDFDGDGLLDLLVGEDPLPGYNGSKTRSSRLFRNKGDLAFEDVTQAVGIPAGVPGYGVAAADVNGDTWPDLFIAANSGGNLLFLNDGKGKFREAPGSKETFAWKDAGGDNMVCGVSFGDVNRDGLPDVVLGPHFQSHWRTPVPTRLYLNRGVKDGVPTFKDVTEEVNLKPLPMKAPHVELQDFDNDGLLDLYASMVKFDADGRPHPMIFKNFGTESGQPRFGEDVLAVNDFPTEEDRGIKRSGTMFDKILAEKKIIYMAPGPSADFDNDGKLDIFLASWWLESPSLLLKNETPGGNWLDVRVEGKEGVNRMGVGSTIRVYPAGKLGDAAEMLGQMEIATGYGYASSQPAVAHFGLGEAQAVDVEVILPHGKGKVVKKGVKANQRVTIGQE